MSNKNTKRRLQAAQICMDSGLNEPAIVFLSTGEMLYTSPVRSFCHSSAKGYMSIETVNTIYYVA